MNPILTGIFDEPGRKFRVLFAMGCVAWLSACVVPTPEPGPTGSPIQPMPPQPTSTPTATPTGAPTATGLYPAGVSYRGINRAGLEYGDDWGGWTGQTYFDHISSPAAELTYYKSKGLNVIRLPISWERIQHVRSGTLDPTYSDYVTSFIAAATAQGFYVILDLHNYNRYADGAFNSSGTQVSTYTIRTMGDGVLTISDLADVWTRLMALVGTNPKVILNLMNEPHDFPMVSTVWFAGVQTVINAIRATGSTQLILVPNSRGSDVDHWSTYSPNMSSVTDSTNPTDSVAALAITDSAGNYAFDMHSYQDTPTSASSYSTQIANVTAWAKTQGKKLFLSELGSQSTTANATGTAAIGGLLSFMNTNSAEWIGWTPWNLPPYSLTDDTYTMDAGPMAWFAPYLTANF